MPGTSDVFSELDGVVRMQIPARPAKLRLVRLVAADLGAQLDFDLEAISELAMAVDEACGQLLAVAAPGALLHCEFRLRLRAVDLLVSTTTMSGDTTLHESTFGWRVLREFTDSVALLRGDLARQAEEHDPAVSWLGIRMSKRDSVAGSG